MKRIEKCFRRVMIALGVFLVSACGADPLLELLSIDAVLVGTVEAEDGSPLEAITVQVIIKREVFPNQGCVEDDAGLVSFVTDAAGRFSARLNGESGRFAQNGCLDLVARPVAGSELLPDSVVNGPIVFRVEAPIDTARVTLVLRVP